MCSWVPLRVQAFQNFDLNRNLDYLPLKRPVTDLCASNIRQVASGSRESRTAARLGAADKMSGSQVSEDSLFDIDAFDDEDDGSSVDSIDVR